jgi:ubiquinone/menaquinone biosynthesis C-methylase UbiE
LPHRFLRLAFYLLYNQLAWTYDMVAWLVSFGQWEAWRRTATLFLQEGPILELGYGTGGLMADMAAGNRSVVGLDFSPYMARRARGRLLRQGTNPRLVRGQAQYLPFRDASFRNVVATFPTEFIFEPQTLTSVARVLRPGGCLVIVAMGYLKGPGPLRRFVDWLYRITGQREIPEPKPLARLNEFGFTARWEDATLEGAKARLVVATRH